MRYRVIWLMLALLSLATALNALGITGKASHQQLSHKASHAQLARRFDLAERRSCINGNIRSVNDNVSHLADYRFITEQVASSRSTQHEFYVALLHAGISKAVLAVALQQENAGLRSQAADAAKKTWTALVDCSSTHRPGAALHVYSIAARMPPLSALSVGNALRVDPVGSVRH